MSFIDGFHALPDDLPKLFESDYSMLTWEVTKNKIHQVLLFLPSSKSPGPCRFNTEFFHFSGKI